MRQPYAYRINSLISSPLVMFITWSYCANTVNAQFSGGPGAGGAQGCLPGMIVLPVRILHISGSCEDGTQHITWSTASERNSSHFTVERSTDAVQWAVVGEVRAAGHSQQVIHYTWTDMQAPTAAVVYYRLRQVDLDGSQEVFQVIAAEACAPDVVELQAWPNPTDGVVAVRMARTQVEEGPLTLVVKDMHGRTLQRSTSVAGTERIRIDLSALAAGTYVLLGLDADGLIIGTTRVIRR